MVPFFYFYSFEIRVTVQYIPTQVQEEIASRQPLIVELGSEQRDGTALQAPASH